MASSSRRWTAGQAREALASAPATPLEDIVPPGRILVVAPHPDDETLGCGGLIALAADAGRGITVACLTDGDASHPHSLQWPPTRLAARRRDELMEAAAVLAGDAARVESFGAPDGRLEAHEARAADWLARIAAHDPYGALFTTWGADPHPDHKAAHRIAVQVAAELAVPLFAYPVWGLILPDEDDAGPVGTCQKLDISAGLARKRAALSAFRSQTGALIQDDPDGFRLKPADLERHLGRYEPFIRIDQAAETIV